MPRRPRPWTLARRSLALGARRARRAAAPRRSRAGPAAAAPRRRAGSDRAAPAAHAARAPTTPRARTGDADGRSLVVTVNADGIGPLGARRRGRDEPFVAAAVAGLVGLALRAGHARRQAHRRDDPRRDPFTAPVRRPRPRPSRPAPAGARGRRRRRRPPPPPPAPLEVTVHGEQPAPGGTSLTRAEVRQLPGAFGDPFRAIETLPGVTPIVSGLPVLLRARRAAGQRRLLPRRRPRAAALPRRARPLGRSTRRIIDRVDLYPGGYPARFGRFAGGIVSGETRDARAELHGEGNIRLFDAGALVEGPLADGRGDVLVGGRYSYTAPLLSLDPVAPSTSTTGTTRRASPTTSRRATSSPSSPSAPTISSARQDAATASARADALRHHLPPRSISATTTASAGPRTASARRSRFGYDQTTLRPRALRVDDRLARARAPSSRSASRDAVLLRAGARRAARRLRRQPRRRPSADAQRLHQSLFSNRTDVAMGVRADAVIAVTPRLEVTPGAARRLLRARAAAQTSRRRRRSAPRGAPRRHARSCASLTALGLASQPPSFILPGPGLHARPHRRPAAELPDEPRASRPICPGT